MSAYDNIISLAGALHLKDLPTHIDSLVRDAEKKKYSYLKF